MDSVSEPEVEPEAAPGAGLRRRAADAKLKRRLNERYQRVLRGYLNGEGETALQAAYELGRWALDSGIGVLDLAAAHHKELVPLLKTIPSPTRAVAMAGAVLLEAYAPFEVAHRGFKEANEVLRHLNERMEEESKRIANALHSEAGQLLVTVHLALHELKREVPAAHAARIEQVRDLLAGVEGELRRFSHELRPALLDDLGLVKAIQFHAEGVAKRTDLRITVTGSTEGRWLPQVETVFYRVVQEALQNVVRHAHATEATVFFRRDPDGLRCFIADDGVGFEPGSIVRKADRGMGLMGIRDRLGVLNGTLEISPGGDGIGTVLVAFVPMDKERET